MCNRQVAAGRFDQSLAEIAGAKLAQTEFGSPEMVDAGCKACGILYSGNGSARKIGADDVEFDFVKRAGAGGSAKESFSLRMFLAANDAGGEEQQLRQSFEIGNGLPLRGSARRRNRGKRGTAGVMEIPRQAHDFERGVNLEQERLVLPVQRVGMHAQALIGMLCAAVVLQGCVDLVVLAQKKKRS